MLDDVGQERTASRHGSVRRPLVHRAEAAARCGIRNVLVPADTYVVIDREGGVTCDESGGLVDDPAAFGEWVAANAEPDDRSITIAPPGAPNQKVELLPVNDRWVVGVENPPTVQAWVYGRFASERGVGAG